MKHNRWLKSTCLLLALCLLLTLLPVSAVAAEETEEKQDVVDFVLLIDCSQTMTSNDPDDLVKEACELFVRLLPIEDARLSIIAFGYEGNAYTYANFDVNQNRWYTDESFVHVVSEMEGNLSVKRRDEISNAIVNVGKNKGTLTPIGAALAAGVDTLLESDSVDGQACIVLMTDGDRTSGELGEDDRLTNESLGIAASHEWPIYAIELDYHGNNEASGSKARALLNKIVEESGAGADGRKKVSNPDEVSKAFMDIVNTFWEGKGNVEELNLGGEGVLTKNIEVAPFTSELNIAIAGGNISEIRLQSENAGVDRVFTKSEMVGEEGAMGNMIVTKNDNNTCIKVICPKSGTWTVTVKGNTNASVDWFDNNQMEMNLAMSSKASKDGELTKQDYITVSACFNYRGVEIRGEEAYTTLPAKLVVKNLDTGKSKTFDMNADKDGFSYQLNMSEAPGSGHLSLSVEIQHGMFRSGIVRSSSDEYTVVNLPHEVIMETVELHSYVNGNAENGNGFPVVDLLKDVVVNPDGDELTYEISCVSDRNNTFFNVQPDENGYMQFPSGMVPGVYELEMVIHEEGLTSDQYGVVKFILTVEDREIEATPIPAVDDMLAKPVNILFIRQDATRENKNVELNSYFSDPDGVALTYGNVECDVPGLVDASVENGVLKIHALEEGECTVTFTVNDGVSTITGQVQVEITDGPKLAWLTYGPMVAAVLGVILAIALIAWSVYANRGVKGQWDVSLYENDMELFTWQDVALGKNIRGRNKHRLLVYEVVSRVCDMAEGMEHITGKYFSGNGAEKILLDAVFFGKGCVLTGLPTDPEGGVVVRVNNSTVTRKENFNRSGSTISVEVTDGMDQLRVELKLH